VVKLAIISDIHYGARGEYLPFLENNRRFFREIFWPYLQKNEINRIVCLGDLVERRKSISYLVADYLQQDLLFPAARYCRSFDWILGNHDIFYRNVTDIHAAKLFLPGDSPAPTFRSYDKATEVMFSDHFDVPILFVPWIIDSNREQIMKTIRDTKAQILFGHLELQNFERHRGDISHEGLSSSVFSKFDVVLTGHFHHRSFKENIYYVGSHAEFAWGDDGEDHGFHIFDTETRGMKFIKNPFTVFRKVWYDDAKGEPTLPAGGFQSLNNKIIKVVVSGKNDAAQYDSFMDKVETAQPLSITVVEDHLNLNLTDDANIVSSTKSTLDIIREFAAQANNIVDVAKLDSLLVKLYHEAESE
jgi:predicted phosphodiesterase